MDRPLPPRRRTPFLTTLLVAVVAGACGGDGGADATADDRQDAPAAGTATPDGTTPDSPTEDTEATAATGPGAAQPGGAAADAEDTAGDPGDGALPPWTTGVLDAPASSPGGVAEVAELRTGRHPTFERVVLTFRGGRLPGFHAEYVDRPLHECGSGRQVHPVGDGWLEIRMEPARGHTEAGDATLRPEVTTGDLPLLRRIYRTCDFEAVVTLVLALESPNPYRVFTLEQPARLVVDVRR